MIKLQEDKIYWIKHNEYEKHLEGEVSKVIKGSTEVSLVRIGCYDSSKNAYFVIPVGRDVMFGIAVKDIHDAVIVENPFEETK